MVRLQPEEKTLGESKIAGKTQICICCDYPLSENNFIDAGRGGTWMARASPFWRKSLQ
jgi:hypothetical protein